MNATAQATPSFINMGTVALVESINAGAEGAKQELMRRVAKGSRFAIKAAKKLGLTENQASAAEADTSSDVESPDDIIEALRDVSGDHSSKKGGKKK